MGAAVGEEKMRDGENSGGEMTVGKALPRDAEAMAAILREIGWSERRNSLPPEEVSSPIRRLLAHAREDPEGHTVYVARGPRDEVFGFAAVHWVPFIMLGGFEGYLSDLFVSPSAGGAGVGSSLVEAVMKEGERRDAYRLMVTNGKSKESYLRGFYSKKGWTERPGVANFTYYYKEPWS